MAYNENEEKNKRADVRQVVVPDSKTAWKLTIRDVVIITICGFIYYLAMKLTPFNGFKCYVNEIFHVKCPACGITRMLMSAIELDFHRAFNYNRFLFITFPYVVYEVIYLFYVNESKKPMRKSNQIILFIWIGLFIIYGIIRNVV